MVSAVAKRLERVPGFQDGDGVKDSSVYLDGHTLVADVRGRDAGAPAFVVRGLDTTNRPTELFRVDKDGLITAVGLPASVIGLPTDPNRALYLSGAYSGAVGANGLGVGYTLTIPPGGDGAAVLIDAVVKSAATGTNGHVCSLMVQPNPIAQGAVVTNYSAAFFRQYDVTGYGAGRACGIIVDSPIGAAVNWSIQNSGSVQMRGASAFVFQQVDNVTDSLIGGATGANIYVPGTVSGDLVVRTASKSLVLSFDAGVTAHVVMKTASVAFVPPALFGTTTLNVDRFVYVNPTFTGSSSSHGVGVGGTITAPVGGNATGLYVDTVVAAAASGANGDIASVIIQPNWTNGGATVGAYVGLIIHETTAPAGAVLACALDVDSPIGATFNYAIQSSGFVQLRGASALLFERVGTVTDALIGTVINANDYVPGSAAGDVAFRSYGAHYVFSFDSGGTRHATMGASLVAFLPRFAVGTFAANAFSTLGVTVDQGTNDDEGLSLQSTGDVAHGMTTVTATTTWLAVSKATAASGGATVRGFAGATLGMRLAGAHTTGNSSQTSGGSAAIALMASLKSGTSFGANGANDNLVVILDHASPRFFFRADGSPFCDVGTVFTNFDDHDDVALLTDLSRAASRPDDPIHAAFRGFADADRARVQALDLVHFDDETGHHFMNLAKVEMLLIGAVRQQAARIDALERLALGAAS